MPSTIRNKGWRDANERGKYPFAHSAKMTNGIVVLANNVFADARLYPVGGKVGQYISSIVKTDVLITINFSDPTQDLASAEISIPDVPTTTVVQITDIRGRVAGVLVTDSIRLATLVALPIGTHKFEREDTELDAVVVTPMPQPGVRSFILADDSVFFGDVWLVGGEGVILELDPADIDGRTIVVHATGDPLFKRVICEDSATGFETPCFVSSINGIPPDEFGNFTITVCGIDAVDTVLRVVPSTSGLTIGVIGGRV